MVTAGLRANLCSLPKCDQIHLRNKMTLPRSAHQCKEGPIKALICRKLIIASWKTGGNAVPIKYIISLPLRVKFPDVMWHLAVGIALKIIPFGRNVCIRNKILTSAGFARTYFFWAALSISHHYIYRLWCQFNQFPSNDCYYMNVSNNSFHLECTVDLYFPKGFYSKLCHVTLK